MFAEFHRHAIENRRGVAGAFLQPNAYADHVVVGQRRRGVVAGGATDRAVGREPFVEVEFLAERDLFRCHRIVFRDHRFPDVGGAIRVEAPCRIFPIESRWKGLKSKSPGCATRWVERM